MAGHGKFAPRGDRSKRSRILPQVRVDEDELADVHRLHQVMCAKDQRRYSVSDVIRMAIARLYDAEVGPADHTADPAKPLFIR